MTLEKPIADSPIGMWENFQHGINRIAMSSDGRRYAASDTDMQVTVYEGGQTVYSGFFGSINEKVKPTERIRGLAFSPDSEVLYVAAGEQVTAIDIHSGLERWTYTAPRSFGFLIISPISLDVSEDGNVVCGFDNGSIVIWDAHGNLQSKWSDNDAPRWVRFLPGGDRIVGSDSFSLVVWDVAKRKRKAKIGMTDRVYGFDVRSCGSVVGVRTLHEVVVWDLVRRDILGLVPVAPGTPIFALHPHEQWVACGERDRIKLASYDGELVRDYQLDVTSALSMAFTPSGSSLIVGCTLGKVLELTMP